jgi:hypothetical protein
MPQSIESPVDDSAPASPVVPPLGGPPVELVPELPEVPGAGPLVSLVAGDIVSAVDVPKDCGAGEGSVPQAITPTPVSATALTQARKSIAAACPDSNGVARAPARDAHRVHSHAVGSSAGQ